jgi:hypothetical protein
MMKVDIMELRRNSFEDYIISMEEEITSSKKRDLEAKRFSLYTPNPAPIAKHLNPERDFPVLLDQEPTKKQDIVDHNDLRPTKVIEPESPVPIVESETYLRQKALKDLLSLRDEKT